MNHFQGDAYRWAVEAFGEAVAMRVEERNHRFLEEALELVQANGCTEGEAQLLVRYVYGRDQGDINQEVGGVMVTLAALCGAVGVDMVREAMRELDRIRDPDTMAKIQRKQAAKPSTGPLPGATS